MKTTEYYLGYYIGEYIVTHYLPTLSIDSDISGLNVVQVNEEDTKEYNRLDEILNKHIFLNKRYKPKEWNNYLRYRIYLYEKYLPKTLVCRIQMITFVDELEIKDGIRSSLWNSDICHYSCNANDIKIYQEDKYFLVIEFPLKLDFVFAKE